jgi:hypothetical protein
MFGQAGQPFFLVFMPGIDGRASLDRRIDRGLRDISASRLGNA